LLAGDNGVLFGVPGVVAPDAGGPRGDPIDLDLDGVVLEAEIISLHCSSVDWKMTRVVADRLRAYSTEISSVPYFSHASTALTPARAARCSGLSSLAVVPRLPVVDLSVDSTEEA
jgi:hypothetical protein